MEVNYVRENVIGFTFFISLQQAQFHWESKTFVKRNTIEQKQIAHKTEVPVTHPNKQTQTSAGFSTTIYSSLETKNKEKGRTNIKISTYNPVTIYM